MSTTDSASMHFSPNKKELLRLEDRTGVAGGLVTCFKDLQVEQSLRTKNIYVERYLKHSYSGNWSVDSTVGGSREMWLTIPFAKPVPATLDLNRFPFYITEASLWDTTKGGFRIPHSGVYQFSLQLWYEAL